MSTRRNFLRSILVSLLVLAPISTWADSSRVDLFRFGNASSPRLDNVRTTDLSTTQRNGVLWVIRDSGGISMFDGPKGQTKNVWKLPRGTQIPAKLHLVNDRDDHWSLMPAVDLTMEEYQAALRNFGSSFVKQN